MKGGTKRRKWGGLGCVARIWVNIVTERRNVNYMRRCMWLGSVTLTRCQGLNWISDPAPLIRDPLPLITNHVPHNWDPAPFCWDPPLCWVESKHQTLLECHKSQTECVECSKTPGRWQSLKTCLEARTCLENENPCLEKSGSVLQFLQAYLCSFT